MESMGPVIVDINAPKSRLATRRRDGAMPAAAASRETQAHRLPV